MEENEENVVPVSTPEVEAPQAPADEPRPMDTPDEEAIVPATEVVDQGGVAPEPVEQPEVSDGTVVEEVPVEVEPEETPHEEDVLTGVAVEESPAYECTPAESVIAWIAQNGISHVDAIRAEGLSEEDKQQAIRDLKMSGKLQGDGSGRVWV